MRKYMVNLMSFVAVVLALTAVAAQAVTIDLVPVGNPGNAADTRYDTSGFGSVGYTYQIGKYEVTAGQYTDFLNAKAKTDTYGLWNGEMSDPVNYGGCNIQRTLILGSYVYTVASEWANRPVNFVSFWSAARFTNWLNNGQGDGDTESGAYINVGNHDTFARQSGAKYVIPTENEWYKAAYHKNDGVTGNYFDYPTSSDSVPSWVLGDPTDPGNNATCWWVGHNDGYTMQGTGYNRSEVGAHENSDSPYGTFDQGGNVWEWNETFFDETAIDPSYPSYRGLRGGAYNDGPDRLLASYRYSFNPSNYLACIGFRVASVPEPGSITLLVAGAASLFAYAWRRRRQTK